MKSRISPFTNTPGVAGNALIETHFADEIIENFESDESFKYVYKIVGLRGSGKSVEYSLVMNHFRESKNWLVYSLSAGGNPIQTLLSQLSKEKFINDKVVSNTISGNTSVGGNIAVVSANASVNTSVNIRDNEHYYSDETDIKNMLAAAGKNGYKVLIGIDDIAKSDEMVRFLSILGSILIEPDNNVRFVCTGLSKNIEDFVNIPHLSFFVRNESIKVKALNLHDVAAKYRKLLEASQDEAVKLARFTKGYAYGYQILGDICFKHSKNEVDEDIQVEFDDAIGPQYDLIWSTMTSAEQDLIKIIVNSKSKSISDIKKNMKKDAGFASLRDRLIKKHILISEDRGMVDVPLPRFKEYVNLWH